MRTGSAQIEGGSAAGDAPPKVGRYRILKELSRGGVGVVYHGVDEGRGKEVAIKRLLPHAVQKPHLLRLFEREYQTLASLDHPRIIEVYEYGLDGSLPYYSMELLTGSDLRDLAPLPFRDACSDLRDIASCLALLHARRLVHRDVSPRNVRRTADDRAKLIDFGAVAGFGASHEVVGTPPCVAPEVLRGLALDARSDLYALGVVAYYALTGRYPYPARELAQLVEVWQVEPLRPSEIVTGVPSSLDDLVMALLSHDPAGRPGSAAEVIEKLTAIGGLPSEVDVRIAQSFLLSPPLVGRSTEVHRFERRLSRALGGGGGSLLVRADAGHGRTRMLQTFAIEAQLRGGLVLLADARTTSEALGVPGQFLDALLRTAPELGAEVIRPRLPVLGAAFPKLLERLGAVSLAELPDDALERRSRVQEALLAVILDVARRAPLILLTDNLESADDPSIQFLASLAFDAKSRALLLVSTLRRNAEAVGSDSIKALRRGSDRMTLRALSEAHVSTWVKQIFADAANHARLGNWLFAMTAGNPAECLELLQHLVESGVIRYENGAWVLPTRIDAREFPASIDQARNARIAALSPLARELLEALSVWRGEIPPELCERLVDTHDRAGAFGALSELVAADLLVSTGDRHRFAHDAIRDRIVSGLDGERRKKLHRRAAEYLVDAGPDPHTQIEAGWHWLNAGDESRGADLLARAGIALAARGDVVHRAIPALEAALEVYDREHRSIDQRAEVLVGLMFGALYADHTIADRYGDRFLDTAARLLGLDLAKTLRRFVGRKLGLLLAISWSALRHAMRRRPDRSSFADLVVMAVAAIGTLASVSAIRVDPKPLDRILRATEPLLDFGDNRAPAALYRIVERVHATTWNLQERAMEISAQEVEKLRMAGSYPDLSPEHRNQLIGGNLTTLALTSGQMGDPKTLEYADQLEEVGLSFYSLIALYSRYLFHAFRGESEKLPALRSQIDYFAVRGGTTWQAEMFVPVNLLDPLIAADDVVGLREVTVRIEKTARDVEVFRIIARFAHAAYQCARGQVQSALDHYASVVEDLRDHHQTEFMMASAGYARALNRSGAHEKAFDVCLRARQEIPDQSRRWGLWATELDIQQSLAELGLGRIESAAARLEATLAEFEPGENPLRLATLHHARALVAVEAGDREAYALHLAAMERWAKPTGNAALLGQLRMLAQKGRRFDEVATTPVEKRAGEQTEYREYLECALATCDSTQEREGILLDLLIQKSGAVGGFLYRAAPDGACLVAARSDTEDEDSILRLKMARLLASFTRPAAEAEVDRTATSTAVSDEGEATTSASGSYATILLTVRERDRLEVVGAAALRRGSEPLADPAPGLVQAIAKALLSSPSTVYTLTALARP